MLDALTSALKHPVSIGTGVGALGGAGMGYFSADENDPYRLRKTLMGAGMGAGLGALTGAMSIPGGLQQAVEQHHIPTPNASITEAAEAAEASAAKVKELIMKGYAQGIEATATKPDIMKGVFEAMHPEHRDAMLASIGAVPMSKVKDIVSNDPSALVEVLDRMDPSHREELMKRFQKGWLTRMFGG